jgi:ABC-type glutathione transport system ATPase component
MTQPLLTATNLSKSFVTRKGLFAPVHKFQAVKDVSIELARGQTLAIVGESGSGKSTLGRMLIRLIDPDSGSIRFDGDEIATMPASQLKPLRRKMQVVFQNPQLSLNPRRTIRQNLERPLANYGVRGSEATDRIDDLLKRVGLTASHAARYPTEISGGQCQRVAIARGLTLEPKFLILDEAVSALDVSVQAQILNLLLDLQDSMGLAYLFITHDLRLVPLMARQVAVMRNGEIVERGESQAVLDNPTHQYTRNLVRGVLQVGVTPDWEALAPPLAELA